MNSDGWPDLILSEQDAETGVSNFRVWLNRSGPMRITQVKRTEEGTDVTWISVPGRSYQVQFKNRLEDAAWSDLGEAIAATTGTGTLTDSAAASAPRRFYRVMQSGD